MATLANQLIDKLTNRQIDKLVLMARDILPTPILEGKDVIEFYNKLANFKENLKKKGITWEVIQEDAKLLKSIFKERPDVEKK